MKANLHILLLFTSLTSCAVIRRNEPHEGTAAKHDTTTQKNLEPTTFHPDTRLSDQEVILNVPRGIWISHHKVRDLSDEDDPAELKVDKDNADDERLVENLVEHIEEVEDAERARMAASVAVGQQLEIKQLNAPPPPGTRISLNKIRDLSEAEEEDKVGNMIKAMVDFIVEILKNPPPEDENKIETAGNEAMNESNIE
ncbi:hypothetical protein TWF694_003488 [Orbilia ellipsospora]|uniref:Uncharacterized protein n=1 Tax=Orbilia ellipsospora TaxID=2528407 RepID=A0AAV9WY79_9PEZI